MSRRICGGGVCPLCCGVLGWWLLKAVLWDEKCLVFGLISAGVACALVGFLDRTFFNL